MPTIGSARASSPPPEYHLRSVYSRRALPAIGACVVLLALTWIAAFHLTWFQRADQHLSLAFYDLTYLYYPAHPNGTFRFLVSLCDPWPYVLLCTLTIAFAFVRGQPQAGRAASIVLLGANLTTLVLKAVLPEPHTASLVAGVPPVSYPRWPSGHSTAALALALAVVFVAPQRLRSVAAALGAAFATVVAVGLLVLGSHLPSDVLGGFLVAVGWSLIAVNASFGEQGRARATHHLSSKDVTLGLGLSLALAVGCVVLAGPHATLSYAGGHGRFVAGALGIAAFSAATCLAVEARMSGVRRSPARG